MTITRVAKGSHCVGKIRLCPIDVGFDLRETQQEIYLTTQCKQHDILNVGYQDSKGLAIVEGTLEEVQIILEKAGYNIQQWVNGKVND